MMNVHPPRIYLLQQTALMAICVMKDDNAVVEVKLFVKKKNGIV